MARRRAIGLVAGALLALGAALVAVPSLTLAHIPNASLSCNQDSLPVLNINLQYYQTPTGGNHNTVSASIDGVSVLSTTNFTNSYASAFSAGSPFVTHTAQVIVFAWDDPTGSHGWTTTINLSSNACQKATSSPSHDPSRGPSASPTPVITHSPRITPSPTPVITHSPRITPSPTPVITASPTPRITASPTTEPTGTPFESFQGDTATPRVTDTPFESFQGETGTPAQSATPPPTSTSGDSPSNGSSPLFALLICLAFGGLGIAAARMQRRSIRP